MVWVCSTPRSRWAAPFLAVVTAVVTANSSAGSSPQALVLDSYRPGLIVVTGIAVAGLLITLPGLRTLATEADRRGRTVRGGNHSMGNESVRKDSGREGSEGRVAIGD